MKYATIENDVITEFPVSEREWRKQSGVSMRKWADCPDSDLLAIGKVAVYDAAVPIIDYRTQDMNLAQTPTLTGGVWYQEWTITDNTLAQIEIYDNKIRKRISEEAERRVEALIPRREQIQRLAKQTMLQDKGKPNWTAAEQAFRDDNFAKWAAVQAVLDKEAVLMATDPPPEDFADDRHWV